jgi:hypothetical protein
MRILSCLIPLILLLSGAAYAQDGFRLNTKGRYEFDHTSYAPEAPKALLYGRLKTFIVEDLNASDTRIQWDEMGQDSVSTIAYVELGNGPEVVNQVVDCRAVLYFRDGEVSLHLSDFNYQGKRANSDSTFGRPLHRMSPVPYPAQSWALAALTETLRQLMDKMDRMAVGQAEKRPGAMQPEKRRRR